MDEAKWMKKKEKALRENNKDLLYESCRKLAELYKEDGNYEESLSYFKRAQDLCEKTVEIAVLNRLIGEVYCDMGMFDNAIKYQKKHLELSKKERNYVEIQRALATLGRTYFIQGQSYSNKERKRSLQNSYDYYLKSEETCDLLTGISSLDLAIMKARLYYNIGLTLDALDISDDSISYLCKSITISKNHDLKSEMIQPYCRLSEVYLKQQAHSEALATIQKCVTLINTQSDTNTLCELLVLKSEVHVDMFDFTSAKVDLTRAYKLKHLNSINQKDVDRHLRIILVLIKNENMLMELDIQQDSEEREKAGLDQAQVKKRIYEHMGDACAALGNYSKAVHFYHKMLDACETVIKITYSTELGIGLSDSLTSCITDLNLVLSTDLCKDLASCYISLAQSYKDNKQYELALDYFKRELTLHSRNFSEACKTLRELCDIYELQEKPFSLIYSTHEKALQLARKHGDVTLQRMTLKSMRKLCEKHDEPFELDQVNKDLAAIKQADAASSSNSSEEELEDSPDIGGDINLEELSDLNSGEEEAGKDEQESKRTNRRRTQRSHFLIKRNDKGETALHVAAARGNLTLVHSLLKQGHPVKVQDSAGWLPLHEAANHGHTEIVAALVDAGADPNDKGGTGISPLHDAAANGYLEVIEILLSKGASTAQRTNQGETARYLLEECKARVEKAQGSLDPAVEAHFAQVVRKLRVPDELTADQTNSGRQQSKPTKLSRDLRPERDLPSRSEYRTQSTLRNRRALSPGSDSSSPAKGSADLRSRSASPESCASGHCSSEEESATKVYQKAISNLRSAQGAKLMTKATFGKPAYGKVKEKQFLEETEVGDDWLERDVVEGVGMGKKRKYYYEESGRGRADEGDPKRVRSENKKPEPQSCRKVETPRVQHMGGVDSPGKLASLPQASCVEAVPKRKSFSPPPELHQRKLATVSRTLEPSQDLFPEEVCDFDQALARMGTCDYMSTRVPASGMFASNQLSRSSSNLAMSGSSTNLARLTAYSSAPPTQSMQDTQSMSRMMSIKIKIEAHTFMIPIVRDESLLGGEKKMSWLKHEASERYYRLEGVTPVLRIKTQDGALIDDNDPLASVLGEALVHTEVVAWNKPPVIQRYYQLCTKSSVRTHKHFESALTADTPLFTICPCAKSASVLLSLFKTFLHWTDLVEINLSRSFLRDDDIKSLSENLNNLAKLQKLSLSCNHVSHVGLKYLSEQCANTPSLQELDVSYNPLTDAALPHLNNMVATCPRLNSLNLSHTNLTRIESDLNLYNLEHINVSRNKLGAQEVRKLLSLLNADLLVSLNLSSTLETPGTLLSLRTIRPLTPENPKTDNKLPCKSPNLYFTAGSKSDNQESRCDLNLPDIISMVPRNPTPDHENDQENAKINTSEGRNSMGNIADKAVTENTQNLEIPVGDENCANIINTMDTEQENQNELDRLLNCSPIMDLPDSEPVSFGTTRDYDTVQESNTTKDDNTVGITREVVLFLEQSECLALKCLSLCDINMNNDEAIMLYSVLNNAKCLVTLNVACNRSLSQRSVELLKSSTRGND